MVTSLLALAWALVAVRRSTKLPPPLKVATVAGEAGLPKVTDPGPLTTVHAVESWPPWGSLAVPFKVACTTGRVIVWSRPALTTGGCGPVGLHLPALPAV